MFDTSPAKCNGLLCDVTVGEQAYEDRQAEGVRIWWVFFAWVCVDVFLWYVAPSPSPSPSPSPPDPDPDPDPDLQPRAGFNSGLAFSADLHRDQPRRERQRPQVDALGAPLPFCVVPPHMR